MAKDTKPGKDGRKLTRLVLTGCLLLGCWAAPAWAAPPPSVDLMLKFRPRIEGVAYTTPAADQAAGCKVESYKGTGWILRDPNGQVLRRFFDLNGTGKVNAWSYYKDGVEVYREIDTNNNNKPDQYRWLNSGGTKWGIDEKEDGHVTAWKVISPEEVSQEILQAVATGDLNRLRALMITDAEIRALDLPADQAKRLHESRKDVAAKFQATLTKVGAITKPTWLHLETTAPECLPADQTGSRQDLVRQARGTILYESGGKTGWLQTGEMIQVGPAWRIVGAPYPGAGEDDGDRKGTDLAQDPELKKLIDELTKMDKEQGAGASGPEAVRYHLRRADQLEKIVGRVKGEDRDPWIRQEADSLSTAAQGSPANDKTALKRLVSLEEQIVKAMEGSNLAAYVTFREMQSDYSACIGESKNDFKKVQGEWLARLTKFVQTYPKGEDTPDAMLQAGMVSEFLEKDVEAKNWYGQLKAFADKPQAAKAAGAIRRLELEGKTLKLAAPLLLDANVAYDIDQARGKITVVYYWASWNGQTVGDFAKLKQLLEANAGKVELVCVNLDNTADEAKKFLAKTPGPGTHLHQPGGLEGKLATDYGIMVLPQLFLLDKEGKVVNRNAQVSTLEDEVRKLLK
jgi:hypothetical protein